MLKKRGSFTRGISDSDDDIAEVLGSNVLNGLIPILDFKVRLIWIMKNKHVPPPLCSKSLGVDIGCDVPAQEDEW